MPIVTGRRHGHKALPRQKRQGTRDDSGRDTGAVPRREVTLAGAFLHGDFAVVKWLNWFVGHGAPRKRFRELSGVQNVRMV